MAAAIDGQNWVKNRWPKMKHVLIIDDNPNDRIITRAFLSDMGCTVTEASDGYEALDLVANYDFSLIVADLSMPHMPGMKLIERLRIFERTSSTPILVVSSYNDTNTIKNSIVKGADGYIIKPLNHSTLKRKAEELMNEVDNPWHEYNTQHLSANLALFNFGQLLSISEVSLSFSSPYNFEQAPDMIINSSLFTQIGLLPTQVKINSIQQGSAHFIYRCSLLNVSEEQRRKIRVFCSQSLKLAS